MVTHSFDGIIFFQKSLLLVIGRLGGGVSEGNSGFGSCLFLRRLLINCQCNYDLNSGVGDILVYFLEVN